MNPIRRVVIAVCAVAVMAASQAVPAGAATTSMAAAPVGHVFQIDPCGLLGPILRDRC